MERRKTQVRARSQRYLSLEAYRCTALKAKWWGVLVGTSVLIALTTFEAAPSEPTPGQATTPIGMQEYGNRNKDCLEWNDTCVNCVRAQSGEEFHCSNIGIACQPKEVKCNRRTDERPK
jgi:hypothetical protein